MFETPRLKIRLGCALTSRPLLGAALIALTFAAPPQAAAANCAGTEEDLHFALCSSDMLLAAWERVESKVEEIRLAHPDLGPALDGDQALFASLLDETLKDLVAEHPPAEVPALLMSGFEERLSFLQSVTVDNGVGIVGRWQNAGGTLHVTQQSPSEAQIEVSVYHPIMGLHTCSVEGIGKDSGGLITLPLPPSDELSLTRAGEVSILAADYTRVGRIAQGPSDCAASAPIRGWYFRIKDEN